MRQNTKLAPMSTILGSIVIVLSASLVTGCSMADKGADSRGQEVITTDVMGSAESPDPVLERVMALEDEGIVQNVIVMESFPVQIRLTAPRYIIDEINAMVRKKLPGLLE